MSSTRGKSKLLVQPTQYPEDEFGDEIAEELNDVEQDEKNQDIDEEAHANLIEALRVIDGKRGRLVQRSEHAANTSEHHKRAGDPSADVVSFAGLVGALHSSASHGEQKKQLRTMQERGHAMNEPLPKPASERLERSVAYEKTAKDLAKWEPVIEENRLAEHLHFPLQRPNIRPPSADGFVQRFQPRTPLEVEVAALLASSDHVLPKMASLTKAEERALRAMDVEEARRRRAELQKHRALLSYKEAKAHRQNKIKSKRYHRILRKEKLKQEEKTLQTLAATDPEAYAQRMDKLDKMRIAERVSLKHRGGSKFAKLKARYGKHDDISRQAISDMYDQSHRLTQKMQLPQAKEGDRDNAESNVTSVASAAAPGSPGLARCNPSLLPSNANNPWLAAGGGSSSGNAGTTAKRVQFTLSGMSSMAAPTESGSTRSFAKAATSDISTGGDTTGDVANNTTGTQEMNASKSHPDSESTTGAMATTNSSCDTTICISGTDQNESNPQPPAVMDVAGCKQKRRKRKAKSIVAGEIGSPGATKLRKELARKDEEAPFTVEGKPIELVDEEHSDEEMISETLERRQTLGDIDNAMQSEAVSPIQKLKPRQVAALLAGDSVIGASAAADGTSSKGQLSKGGTTPKQVHVTHSKLPDVVDTGGTEQRLNIIEAFADDDVIEEFSQEKHALEERDKPKDIDLTLPGWGEWGGAGVLPENVSSKQKRRRARRFIVKAPPAPPRQDRNLSKVIISQAKNTGLAKHQVSELPYPFTSIQQYESSIRMPIGKTWNAETAFRSMIVPHITTQIGAIIDPIDSSEVFKKQKRKQKQLNSISNAAGVSKLSEPASKAGGPAAASQRWKQGRKKLPSSSATAGKHKVKTNRTKAKL